MREKSVTTDRPEPGSSATSEPQTEARTSTPTALPTSTPTVVIAEPTRTPNVVEEILDLLPIHP
jgi:hypothetical protein